MDRSLLYSQETVRSFDLLSQFKDIMVDVDHLTRDICGGATTVVTGLAATPDSPLSLSVNLGLGRIYQSAARDATAYGSIGADSETSYQQGLAAAQRITLVTSSIGVGQSQYALVQAQFSQVDSIRVGDPTQGVLNFWNPNNPSQPFIGPNNDNQPLNTVRQGICVISVIYGSPASTGSEVPPQPSVGFVPLYLVDLVYGQTTITSGNILTAGPSVGTGVPSNYPVAPFLAGLLNKHHSGTTGQAPQIDLTAEVKNILPLRNLPASSANSGGGLSAEYCYAGNPNGHVAGVQGVAGVSPPDSCWDITDGQLYICSATGTTSTAIWVTVSGRAGSILWGGTSTGSANAQVLTPSPAAAAYVSGLAYAFIAGFTNTSATTINISGLGVKNLYKESGGGPIPCTGGELVASNIYTVQYDGTEFQIIATNSLLATLGIGYGLRNEGDGNLQANDSTVVVSSNRAAVAADHKTQIVAGAAITLTVPHSTTLWNGYGFRVVALNGAITITPNASDTINLLSAGVSLTIPQGASAQVACDGNGHLYVHSITGGSTVVNIIEIVGYWGDWDGNFACHHYFDLCNAGTALGGACYQGFAQTLYFNGATVGAGGMDTGAMPVGGSLYLYVIYNPTTNTWAVMGTTNGAGSRCYGGIHFPSGYTASCLISAFCTDSSGNLRRFHQKNNHVYHTPVTCLDHVGAGAANTYQSLSIATIVPVCATQLHGNCGSSVSNGWNPVISLSADSNGISSKRCVLGPAGGAAPLLDNFAVATPFESLPLRTSQLFYWKASDLLTRTTLEITGYDI